MKQILIASASLCVLAACGNGDATAEDTAARAAETVESAAADVADTVETAAADVAEAFDGDLAPALAALPSGDYALEETHASLTWKVNHLGLSNYTARFTQFDVDINLDTDNIEASSVTATVNPASVETDYPYPEQEDFNKKLAEKPEWFNTGEYPEMTFTSTRIEQTGPDSGLIYGDLTMLGQTREVVLDTQFIGAMESHPFAKVPAFGISATGMIDRTDWGFSTATPNIGADVQIIIEAEFLQKQAS